MTSYSWARPVSGDWIDAADWSPAAVPNEPATGLTPATEADVTIDNPTLAPYLVTIGPGEVWTINSLTMNGTYDLLGSNTTAYPASALVIDGVLNFGPGSPGTIGGSLQTQIFMNNGTILNPGTINAFLQAQGTVLLTGTNGIYITNELQAQGGVVTIDTSSIAELSGNTLFDGIFQANGLGGVVNLGGPREHGIVNIATVVGPPLNPTGWTELTLDGTLTEIGEWNGTAYAGIETTLQQIGARGTVDVLGGRNYVTSNALTIQAGGLLNLQAGPVTAPVININGGTVQGSGDITGGVVNNGTLRAEGGVLTVGTGGLSGVGLVTFDYNQQTGTVSPTGTTMQVYGVGPAQTFVMNGDDSLVISTPASFQGVIDAKVGDKVILGGVVANSAVVSGGTLLLQENGATVYRLSLNAADAGARFSTTAFGTGNTEVQMTGSAVATATATASTAQETTIGPVSVVDVTNGASVTVSSASLSGTAAAIVNDLATISPATLNITTGPVSLFISTGGVQSIDASAGGANVVAAVTGGSAFITGGPGDETFAISALAQSANGLSTITDFHAGDSLLLLGAAASGLTTADNAGAAGATGLGLTYTAANGVSTGVVLAGLSGSSVSESSGSVDGVSYLLVRANAAGTT